MLEAEQHAASCFVTMTYRNEDLAMDVKEAKRDHTLFMKKLRERVGKVRFYSVLHSGETTRRLHWHMALFGYRPGNHRNPTKWKVCNECHLCQAWALGGVHVGALEVESAGYVVAYLTEKDKALYATMSRRPYGIGGGSATDLSSFYTGKTGSGVLAAQGDVVGAVRRDGKLWPLGRYLRGKLREATGMAVNEPPNARHERVSLRQAELRTPGGIAAREEQRAHDGARSARLVQISRSKKGIGV